MTTMMKQDETEKYKGDDDNDDDDDEDDDDDKLETHLWQPLIIINYDIIYR